MQEAAHYLSSLLFYYCVSDFYSASVTSPDTLAYDGGSAVVSQAEPNGIYTNGLSTSATFILAMGAEGEIKPEYVEQEIRVSQNKIRREICEEWSLPDDY